MRAYAAIAEVNATTLRVCVPYTGPWVVTGELIDAVELSGQVEARIGDMSLVGTVQQHGVWSMRSSVRIVAGAGGWAKTVEPKHYHSDAGIRTRLIVQDLARMVGETVETCRPQRDYVGIDFTVRRAPASYALKCAIDKTPWWVDYEGKTHIAQRELSEISGEFEVLEAYTRAREVLLALEDLAAVQVGSILRGRLERPLVVHSIEHVVNDAKVQTRVWGVPL